MNESPPDSDPNVETLRSFFNTLERTQWLQPKELQAYQRGQLSQLLKHAYANSLFYRERLSPLFRSDGSIDWSQWPAIPILTRNDVREHGLLMHCVAAPERHGSSVLTSTSGTSGRPLQFTMTSLTRLARYASLYRTHVWHRLDWHGVHGMTLTMKKNEANWPEGMDGDHWGPPWLEPPSPRMQMINANTAIPDMVEWLIRKKINYLLSQAITHDAIAQAAFNERHNFPLKAMLSFGMRVEQRYRDHVRDALGIPIIELYGSEESGAIAHQCPSGHGLHIISELLVVEILDENNEPCRPGKTGRVVTTVLHNAAQPLIRYDQGDLATPGPQCGCGRGLPVIAKVEGRVRNLFTLPDGQTFSPSLASSAFIELLHAHWWQVAQTGAKTIEVRFHPQQSVSEENYAGFSKIIAETWSKEFEVIFRTWEGAYVSGSRKHIDFVNETVPPA